MAISEERLIILVQEHECLYNLGHKDYDNNLIKDNIWKEIAITLYTTGKHLFISISFYLTSIVLCLG